MNIKESDYIDTFKEEYHLKNNDELLKEARDMMRRRTNQRVWEINKEQREKERAYFYDCFNKYFEESIYSDTRHIERAEEYLSAIEKMGRRAAPFLYELMRDENTVLNDVLEKIYNCKFKEDVSDDIVIVDDDIYEMKMKYEELKNKWMRKIEREGDI